MIENITRAVENLTKSSSTYENISKTTIISAKINETVKTNGISITVKNVKTTKWLVLDYLGGKKSFPSKDGYKFVMLFVILNNTGPKSESIMFSVWNESIITDRGYLYGKISDWEIMNRYDKSREPTEIELKEYYCLQLQTWRELPPGEWIGGCYLFEIKEDHEPVIFSFNVGVIGGKIININLKS